VLSMAVVAGVHTAQVIRRQPQAEMQHFPAGAVAYLQAHPISGPLFNHYDWGGYLIWKLYPSTRVFIDGRADLYGNELHGEDLLHQFAATYQLKDDWRESLQHWNIHTVLVPANSALATGLRNVPGWTICYEDTLAVIFTLSRGIVGTESAPNARNLPKSLIPGKASSQAARECGTVVTVGMQEITPLLGFCRLLCVRITLPATMYVQNGT